MHNTGPHPRTRGGYYTVLVSTGETAGKIPYTVFAKSDYEAARMVRQETGHLATQHDVDGPYLRF